MFKQLAIIFALVSFFSAYALAQEKPETTSTDKKECTKESKSCCASKESQSSMQMNESKETATVQIWNKVCPVKGEETEADAPTFEYNGKIIGFCCPGCDSKFQKDPEKYMKNLNEDGTKFIGKS